MWWTDFNVVVYGILWLIISCFVFYEALKTDDHPAVKVCWIFFWPIMVAGGIVVGFLLWLIDLPKNIKELLRSPVE